MSDFLEDFDLTGNSLNIFLIIDLFLFKYLDCDLAGEYELHRTYFLPRQHVRALLYLSESALTKRLSYIKTVGHESNCYRERSDQS